MDLADAFVVERDDPARIDRAERADWLARQQARYVVASAFAASKSKIDRLADRFAIPVKGGGIARGEYAFKSRQRHGWANYESTIAKSVRAADDVAQRGSGAGRPAEEGIFENANARPGGCSIEIVEPCSGQEFDVSAAQMVEHPAAFGVRQKGKQRV